MFTREEAEAQGRKVPAKDKLLTELEKEAAAIEKSAPHDWDDLQDHYQAALRELETAKAAQDACQDYAAYEKAGEAVEKAETKRDFCKAKLDSYRIAARVPEDEYLKKVAKVKALVEDQAARYQEIQDKAIAELRAAREALELLASDATEALEAYESAALVLHARHPHSITWRYDLLIYDDEHITKLATCKEDETGRHFANKVQLAAWAAGSPSAKDTAFDQSEGGFYTDVK